MSALYVNTLQALTGSQVVVTGSLNIQSNLTVGGTFTGTITTASFASTASFVQNAQSASFVGSAGTLTQNLILSGSVRGEVKPLSISSNTASMDLNSADFFTLTLVSGSTTYLNPTNLAPGKTVNLKVTQASALSGSLNFAPSVSQSFGNTYVPSKTGSAVDILTFVSFDSSYLYMTNVNNLK